MTLRIDWDNYEVLEAEDYTPWELSDTIEDVREAMDQYAETCGNIPEQMEELLVALAVLEEELEDED